MLRSATTMAPFPAAVFISALFLPLLATANLGLRPRLGVNLNPIDRCWRNNENWDRSRTELARCSIGFTGRMAQNMGKDVTMYEVVDSSDVDPSKPRPGTLRYGVTMIPGKVWVTFGSNMFIKLKMPLFISAHTTIDGRGADVHIAYGSGFVVHEVHDVIIHGLHFHDVKSTSAGNVIVPGGADHSDQQAGPGRHPHRWIHQGLGRSQHPVQLPRRAARRLDGVDPDNHLEQPLHGPQQGHAPRPQGHLHAGREDEGHPPIRLPLGVIVPDPHPVGPRALHEGPVVEFLLDAAPSDPQLRDRIRSLADADISHRRIFVAGFGSDVTDENLFEVFSSFGPIEDCYVVVDKATRRGKGYGFVLFKARSGAVKALKEPQKWIGSRLTTCQVASVGREKPDIRDRKIYVFNVPPEVRQERLREFFTKFGEIESGVMGFDGNSRAYAAFVYKTQEEAKKAMVEPHKKFDGHPLHCRMAVASIGEVQKVATPVSHVQTVAPAATAAVAALAGVPQQSVLAAVAPAQNIASLGQNPAYAALLPRNPLLTTAALNPSLVNAAALGRVAGVPYGGGAQSMLGGYSTRQVSGAIGLQGLQGYQAGSYSEGGQSSGKAGGDFGGYKASYL